MKPFCTFLLIACFAIPAFAQEDHMKLGNEHESKPYVTLTAGLLIPNPEAIPGTDVGTSGLPIHIKLNSSLGYQVTPHLGVGLGSGLMILDRGMVIPMYAEFRANLLKGNISPIVYGQLGGTIPVYNIGDGTDWWGNEVYEDFNASGGLMMDVGFGIRVKNNSQSATTLTIGFQSMKLSETYKAWGTRYQNDYQFQRLSIQGGWLF